MKGYSTLMITAAMLAASGTAQAQAGADRAKLHDFAACVVEKDRVRAESLMKEIPGSIREEGTAKRIAAGKECRTTGATSTNPGLIRPAIAEALFEADFGADGASKGGRLATPYSFDKAVKVALVEPGVKPGLGLIDIAQCVAKSDRKATLTLFTTVPGSEEETTAFEPLEGHFNSCTPADVSTTIQPAAMRGALAEALYRTATDKSGAK